MSLMEELDRQTAILSSSDAMLRTAAARAVKAQGQAAVPMLLNALEVGRSNPIAVMTLLYDITGANPVPHQDRGVVDKMIQHWITWGKTRHHSGDDDGARADH